MGSIPGPSYLRGIEMGRTRLSQGKIFKALIRWRLFQRCNALKIFPCDNLVRPISIPRRYEGPGIDPMLQVRWRAFAIVWAHRHPTDLIAGAQPVDARRLPLAKPGGTSRDPNPSESRRKQPSSEVIRHPAPGFVAYPDPAETRIENPLPVHVRCPAEA